MTPDLRELVSREADRREISKSELTARALRMELDAPLDGELRAFVDPRLVSRLHNSAASFDRRPAELLEALLRDHLPSLTEEQIDPKLRKARAHERAKELLAA
jgi:hypothetical protein